MVSTPNGEASMRGYQVGTVYLGPMGMQLLLLSVTPIIIPLTDISPSSPQTHLSMELVSKLKKPHCFIPDIPKHTVVCAFCKHKIGYKQG